MLFCTYTERRKPLESDMQTPKLISEMTAREVRARWIQVRRRQNATARRLGFKNYKAWQPEDERE